MKHCACVLSMLFAVGLRMVAGPAEEGAACGDAASREEIRVIDVAIVSTNEIVFGTNRLSLAAATNTMAVHRDTVDVVVVHGPAPGGSSPDQNPSALARIAGVGVPVMIVEKDGEYAWREQSNADGVRTLQVGTTEFNALRRLWTRQKPPLAASSAPTLKTTVKWDAVADTYELSRVELGLFGKRVWLMHELRETGDESGTVGIRIKKEW